MALFVNTRTGSTTGTTGRLILGRQGILEGMHNANWLSLNASSQIGNRGYSRRHKALGGGESESLPRLGIAAIGTVLSFLTKAIELQS